MNLNTKLDIPIDNLNSLVYIRTKLEHFGVKMRRRVIALVDELEAKFGKGIIKTGM